MSFVTNSVMNSKDGVAETRKRRRTKIYFFIVTYLYILYMMPALVFDGVQ